MLPLLVMALALGMTYVLWQDAQSNSMKELNTEFRYRELEATERVRQRMLDYDQMLRGLRGLFSASNSVDRQEFHEYYDALNLAQRYKGVQAVAFVQFVTDAEKNVHIAKIHSEGFPAYTIWPQAQSAYYAPIVYIEPSNPSNLLTLGFDLSSESSRHSAMLGARDSNSTHISGKLNLVQAAQSTPTPGLVMLLPIYRNGVARATIAQRQSALLGWVETILRIEELMAGVLGIDDDELDIEIFDGKTLAKPFMLYDKDKFFRAGNTTQLLQTTRQLEIAGRIWTIRFSSLPAFEQRLNSNKPQFIALVGVGLSLLLGSITWILIRARARSLHAAHLLSHELQARIEAQESLKLASLVYEHSSEGILVTDEENRIIASNPAFTRITGYKLADVQGKDPRYFSSGRHDLDFYKAMWKELTQTGHWQGEIWDRHKNGEDHAKYLTINTIYHEDGSVFRRVALFMDISDKKESEELIWRQANFDPLTQLPNRSMFHDRLLHEVRLAQRGNFIFALLFIDLDLFKEVNDTLGHHVGDLLLIDAALRISSCVRNSDTVARLGGDEFTVILGGLSDVSSIERVAAKILQDLAAPYKLGDEVVYITGSIGITLYPHDATDPDGLLKNADQAMYVAKNMGRNRISYFTQALQESAQARLRMITDLREAITQEQFVLHYQPIVDLSTGEIHKAEALVRWQHPKQGLVPPNDFIPLAEETGLITEIGDWVFREAARHARRLREYYHPAFQISVNKSPKQFRDSGTTIALWFEYLKELGLPGDSITIEITESLLLNAISDITDKLRLFREGGIQIAIDDFGTGYSSLSYLKRFHIDYLKIDQSFVRDIETDANDLALSRAIIVMAHALGLKVIAEGVETATQLALLKNAECDFAQGYFFSRPVPAAEFEALLDVKPVGII